MINQYHDPKISLVDKLIEELEYNEVEFDKINFLKLVYDEISLNEKDYFNNLDTNNLNLLLNFNLITNDYEKLNSIIDTSDLNLAMFKSKEKILELISIKDYNESEFLFQTLMFFYLCSDYFNFINNKEWTDKASMYNLKLINDIDLNFEEYNGNSNILSHNNSLINSYELLKKYGSIEKVQQLILGYKFIKE